MARKPLPRDRFILGKMAEELDAYLVAFDAAAEELESVVAEAKARGFKWEQPPDDDEGPLWLWKAWHSTQIGLSLRTWTDKAFRLDRCGPYIERSWDVSEAEVGKKPDAILKTSSWTWLRFGAVKLTREIADVIAEMDQGEGDDPARPWQKCSQAVVAKFLTIENRGKLLDKLQSDGRLEYRCTHGRKYLVRFRDPDKHREFIAFLSR